MKFQLRALQVILPTHLNKFYIFGENGQITSVTDANGEQVLYEYDDNGRLISQQIAGSDRVLSYGYV